MKVTKAERLDLESLDVAAEKRSELKRHLGDAFPEVFTEGSIDFDQLKRALGGWIDPSKERFGLNWPGKADCMKIIQQASVAKSRKEGPGGCLRPTTSRDGFLGSSKFEASDVASAPGPSVFVLESAKHADRSATYSRDS